MNHILKCGSCGKYGLEAKCPCGGTRSKPKPPKYSPEDKYGKYRREFNQQSQKEESDGELEDNDTQEGKTE